MPKRSVDDPFRFTWPFALTMLMVYVPVFYYWRPWNSSLPLISVVAMCIFIPFFVALLIYGPIVVYLQIKDSGKHGRELLKRSFVVIASAAVLIVGLEYLGYLEKVRSWIVLPLTIFAICYLGSSKKKNK